jgi:hypothetical protein
VEGGKEMNRRQKASDVFRETNYFIGEKTTFEKAFPEIENIRVTVEEFEDFFSDGRKRFYSKENAGEYIDCSNPICYNGGFSLGSLIRNMVSTRQTELETTKFCQGYEGSPKGRKRYGPCEHRFKVKIEIKYKDTTQT